MNQYQCDINTVYINTYIYIYYDVEYYTNTRTFSINTVPECVGRALVDRGETGK